MVHEQDLRDAIAILQWHEEEGVDLVSNFFNGLLYRLYQQEVEGFDLLIHEWNKIKSILFNLPLSGVMPTSYCGHFQHLVSNACYQRWKVMDNYCVIFEGTNTECHEFIKSLECNEGLIIVAKKMTYRK